MMPDLLAFLAVSAAASLALPLGLNLGPERRRAALAWAVGALGVAGLLLAFFGSGVHYPDLAPATGAVLAAGISGSGWAPRGRRALLLLALAGLVVGVLARAPGLGLDPAAAEIAGTSLTWAVARSSGFVSFAAAAGAIVLGARRPARLLLGGLPARVYALHRALGVAALLSTAVHLVSLWLDEFIEFSLAQLLLVPWTASYEPLGVTLGWLAMVFLLLAAASGALRRRLPAAAWRAVHALAYPTFALGLAHGLLAGTDAGSPLALAFYLLALLAVLWATYRRLSPRYAQKKKVPTREPWSMPDTTRR